MLYNLFTLGTLRIFAQFSQMVAASSALPAAPMWRMIALIFNNFHKHRINITHVAGTEGSGRG